MQNSDGQVYLLIYTNSESPYADWFYPDGWNDDCDTILIVGVRDFWQITNASFSDWVEENCDADVYEEIFGPVEE